MALDTPAAAPAPVAPAAPQAPVAGPQGPQSAEAVIAELENGQQAKTTDEAENEGSHTAHEIEPLADEQVESVLSTLAKGSEGTIQRTVIEQVARTGEISEGAMEALADDLGMSAEDVTGIINGGIRPAFEAQARSAIADTLGTVDDSVVQACMDHMGEHQPLEVTEAIRLQLLSRTTDGYRQMAQDYLERLDEIAPDAILGAEMGGGVKAVRDSLGAITVTGPSGESLIWREAVRGGYVKLGG